MKTNKQKLQALTKLDPFYQALTIAFLCEKIKTIFDLTEEDLEKAFPDNYFINRTVISQFAEELTKILTA